MAGIIIALLLLLAGFVLVFLELTIPSFGMIGLASAGCFGVALVLAFSHSLAAGFVFVGLLCVGVPLVLWIWVRVFPKTAIGRRMILQGPGPGTTTVPDARAELLGAEGVVHSTLRPSGIALFDGQRVDVVTEGKMVQAGTPVRVIEVSGNRVVVRTIDKPAS
jgi:membrane-bound serine protease (ClpP class)